MTKCIHAYTPSQVGPGLVPYFNLSRYSDGTFVLTVRDSDGRTVSMAVPKDQAIELAEGILLETRV